MKKINNRNLPEIISIFGIILIGLYMTIKYFNLSLPPTLSGIAFLLIVFVLYKK